MEDEHSLYKGKKVVIWLRSGYTFPPKDRVGYDLVRNDEDLLIGLSYGSHLFVSPHIRSADLGNR